MKKYGRTRKAVEETIRICIDKNVLADYLEERKVEVMDIMTTLFDEEEVSRRFYLRIKREAKEQGMQQGMQESAEKIARNMLADGISYEKISAYTGLSVSEIEKIARDTKYR